MTFYACRLLSPAVQVYWVLKCGAFLLAQHQENQGGANLYHCKDDGHGFFVEVGIEDEQPGCCVAS